MTVAQWDICTAKVWDQDHPVVVLTPTALCRQPFLNVLGCSTLYSARQADLRHEITLDEADGLERPTLCKLSPIHLVEARDLHRLRGRVCAERQRQMGAQLIRLYGLWLG
ncbi:MAG: hypothetical protein HZA90_24220 [Verrucomicrobia bacterium]|nr:hypothetical protein [Verrucomicrobiota bacterium]